MRALAILLAVLAVAAAPGGQKGADAMSLQISSPSFSNQGAMPSQFTCEGPDRSPPLQFSGAPQGTKSLALIVDDPDAPDPAAPKMTWVHWLVYDLPPNTAGLAEGVAEKDLPKGTREGTSNYGKTSWGGPCPPTGRHRYFFKLYALDTELPDLGKPDKAKLEKAMQGHILAKAEMVGTYEKTRH